MTRYTRPLMAIAVALATLAGFVDAIGFLKMGGFFVSFMSGNSTRLGVGLGGGQLSDAMLAGALIASFVSGVIWASIVARAAGAWRKAAVMTLVAVMLAGAAVLGPRLPGALPALLIAMAMGAENGVFARDGEVTIGVTYFTGTLVRFGQKLSAALMGDGPRWDWVPHLLLWAGFVAGVTAGARGYRALSDDALWFAAGVAAALAVLLARYGRVQPVGATG